MSLSLDDAAGTALPRAAAEITVNGAALLADISGALIWPERRVLLAADLHLEKGSAFAASGRFLPPYDTAATLKRLAAVMDHYAIEAVYSLGDSFHDEAAGGRIAASDAEDLAALTRRCRWTWILGNHDPATPAGPWDGEVAEEAILGPLVLRHEASAGPARPAGEVSGHFHPKAAVRVRDKRLSRRCFIGDGRRLILPAFGAYTGGLNVLDPAIACHFPGGFDVRMIGERDLYAFPSTALLP